MSLHEGGEFRYSTKHYRQNVTEQGQSATCATVN